MLQERTTLLASVPEGHADKTHLLSKAALWPCACTASRCGVQHWSLQGRKRAPGLIWSGSKTKTAALLCLGAWRTHARVQTHLLSNAVVGVRVCAAASCDFYYWNLRGGKRALELGWQGSPSKGSGCAHEGRADTPAVSCAHLASRQLAHRLHD